MFVCGLKKKKLIRNANIICGVNGGLPVNELNDTLPQLVHSRLFLFCLACCGYHRVWSTALQKLTSGENAASAWESLWEQLNSWKFQYFLYSVDGNWLALSENVAKVSTSLRKWLPRPLERSSRGKAQGSRGFFDPTLNTGGFRLRWNWKCLTESIRWLTSAFWDSSLRLIRGLGLEAIIAAVLSFSPARRELKYPFFFFSFFFQL